MVVSMSNSVSSFASRVVCGSEFVSNRVMTCVADDPVKSKATFHGQLRRNVAEVIRNGASSALNKVTLALLSSARSRMTLGIAAIASAFSTTHWTCIMSFGDAENSGDRIAE